jgi:hypothetical protein
MRWRPQGHRSPAGWLRRRRRDEGALGGLPRQRITAAVLVSQRELRALGYPETLARPVYSLGNPACTALAAQVQVLIQQQLVEGGQVPAYFVFPLLELSRGTVTMAAPTVDKAANGREASIAH